MLSDDTVQYRSIASKLGLLCGSIIFIYLVAGSVQVVGFILSLVVAGFGLIAILDNIFVGEVARRRAAAMLVCLIFIALVMANVMGGLSTLTGTQASLEGQLPLLLGISFYALQIAGIGSDLLRGLIPRPALLDYLVFILLGFKFYSGPLERGIDLDRVVNQKQEFNAARAWESFSWIVLGFFMKYVIANPLAMLIDVNAIDPLSNIFVATIAEFRIYFDFAGYSFMAVGLAKLAGIELTVNFRQPLSSPNITIFWRRWHVSFGRYLWHYFYSPMKESANRRNISTQWIAPSIFVASALWHGATFNFALWGALHAAAFLLYTRLLSKAKWPPVVGHTVILLLLIFARMLCIDPDTARLYGKLLNFFDPLSWRGSADMLLARIGEVIGFKHGIVLLMAVIFLVLEPLSERIYHTLDYTLFRTVTGVTLMLLLIFAFAHQEPNAIFVYARN